MAHLAVAGALLCKATETRRLSVRSTSFASCEVGDIGSNRFTAKIQLEECYTAFPQFYTNITDGWQRYQAATACGWEQLPVRIYETALDALAATETASIVREWLTYEWAQYCQSVAAELEADSTQALAELVADRTVKSPRTVRRYLSVLSLPEETHPLLTDGPAKSANFSNSVSVRRPEFGIWKSDSKPVSTMTSSTEP